MTESDSFPVVIIGGGLAGLTAGLHLAEKEIPPLILETDSHWPGGRLSGGDDDAFIHQEKEWRFRPDHGMHALWGEYRNMRRMLTHNLDIPLFRSQGEDWINRWGDDSRIVEAGNMVRRKWLPAPFHYLQLLFRPKFWRLINIFDFLSFPGFMASILLTVGFDPIKEQRPLDGLRFDEYFRGWTANLKATFVGLGANLLAAPPERISLTGFIAAIRFFTMLRPDSWEMDFLPGNSHDYLVRPLISAIESREGWIMNGVRATRLEPLSGGGWKIDVVDALRGGNRSLYAENIILAVDPPSAQKLLEASPSLSPSAENYIFPDGVKNATVRIWFSRQPRQGAASGMFTGDCLLDNFFWLHRLFDEFKDWGEAGGSAIEVHVYADETILEQPERLLLIQVLTEIQRVWPELRGSYVHSGIRINSRHHSVFRVPDHRTLHIETPWQNCYACGDWVGADHPSLWMERSVTTGIMSANSILEKGGKHPYQILYPRPPGWLAQLLERLIHAGRFIIGKPLMFFRRNFF